MNESAKTGQEPGRPGLPTSSRLHLGQMPPLLSPGSLSIPGLETNYVKG